MSKLILLGKGIDLRHLLTPEEIAAPMSPEFQALLEHQVREETRMTRNLDPAAVVTVEFPDDIPVFVSVCKDGCLVAALALIETEQLRGLVLLHVGIALQGGKEEHSEFLRQFLGVGGSVFDLKLEEMREATSGYFSFVVYYLLQRAFLSKSAAARDVAHQDFPNFDSGDKSNAPN